MEILQTIINKYKAVRQKSLNKKEFKRALLEAVNDGKLTKEEIDELDKKKNELGLTDKDVKEMKAEIFLSAFLSAKSDAQITREEAQELERIQRYLGIEDIEIRKEKKELARLRLLTEIIEGNFPPITISGLVLQKGEKVHWTEPAILMEERVVRRYYKGGYSGFSFRITKGVSYRIGGFRGHPVRETGVVGVSNGELIITNKRIIFRGDKKSFAIKLDKILDIQLFTNGLQISENNRSKPILIKFLQKGNHDIIGTIISYTINHYGESDK